MWFNDLSFKNGRLSKSLVSKTLDWRIYQLQSLMFILLQNLKDALTFVHVFTFGNAKLHKKQCGLTLLMQKY